MIRSGVSFVNHASVIPYLSYLTFLSYINLQDILFTCIPKYCCPYIPLMFTGFILVVLSVTGMDFCYDIWTDVE